MIKFLILQVGAHCASLRLGIDLRLFHILVQHKGVPVSASQLAELSKAELLLIGTWVSTLGHRVNHMLMIGAVRIMRVITSIGFALELDEQTYIATPLTTAITNPALEAGMKIRWD